MALQSNHVFFTFMCVYSFFQFRVSLQVNFHHTRAANIIRIVNFINIVFIDSEMKETNYARNRVENSR